MKNQYLITLLENCIRVLDGLRPEQLDLEEWVSECGTTACVIGHCMRDSWFNEQGLSARDNAPRMGFNHGWSAVRGLLNLQSPWSSGATQFQAYLFNPSYYSSPTLADVRERLQLMVNLLRKAEPITVNDLKLEPPRGSDFVSYFNTYFAETI